MKNCCAFVRFAGMTILSSRLLVHLAFLPTKPALVVDLNLDSRMSLKNGHMKLTERDGFKKVASSSTHRIVPRIGLLNKLCFSSITLNG